MTLKPKLLRQELIDAFTAADRASAKGTPSADDFDTPQKRKDRQVQAEALATAIIKHIVANAEVIIPAHPSAVTMTGVAPGPGPHAHPTNQPPIPHIIGRIK